MPARKTVRRLVSNGIHDSLLAFAMEIDFPLISEGSLFIRLRGHAIFAR